MTLLIAPTITLTAMELKIQNIEGNNNEILCDNIISEQSPQFLPPWWLIGADQKQLIGDWGFWAIPQYIYVQEFKPTKERV